jgi:hypothetical protein
MPSLRRAINLTCRQCIFDEKAEGTWRQQVEACTDASCGLHPVRPVTIQKSPETDESQPPENPS